MKRQAIIVAIASAINVSPAFAGKANDALEAQSEGKRSTLFTAAIGKSGFNCGQVTTYLFMGEKAGADWFSLRCRNGQDFALRIMNVEDLPTRALPCKALEAAGAACWTKLD
ncbi:hypothetical protein ACFQ14_13635 [Pseudahrensia aquimaris]|uniref:Secreted protein n=1 Tax=Pseudahrensia aquimaris TaxID=744461 RepID=A0ABW3FKJ9_9HYPH